MRNLPPIGAVTLLPQPPSISASEQQPNRLPIRIVLASRNGAVWLPEQLQSFVAQTHDDWQLLVSDDGSRDDTRAVIAGFAADHPQRDVQIVEGPGQGSAANFLSALAHSVAERPGMAVAFSDQDDVWLPQKLERAAAWLASLEADGDRANLPAAYQSDSGGPDTGKSGTGGPDIGSKGVLAGWVCRTVLTDPALKPIGESRRFDRPTGFGNALVQNILAGNTIVLSPAAAQAVAATVPTALKAGVPYHDWWVYLVLSGLGAQIRIEEDPLVLYRQHGQNHLGHHGPLSGRLKRLSTVARRDYSSWLDANLAALSEIAADLTPEARRLLRGFRRARRRKGAFLAASLPRLGLYRQTAKGDRLIAMMARTGRL